MEMFQTPEIELMNDLWSIFNKIQEDSKVRLRTIGAFRDELRICKRDLGLEIKNLKKELEEVRSQLEDANRRESLFKETLVEAVKAGVLLHKLAAKKELQRLMAKNKVASEELLKQTEAAKIANKALKVEREFMHKFLKEQEEAMKSFIKRNHEVQQREGRRREHEKRLHQSGSKSINTPSDLTTFQEGATSKRSRE